LCEFLNAFALVFLIAVKLFASFLYHDISYLILSASFRIQMDCRSFQFMFVLKTIKLKIKNHETLFNAQASNHMKESLQSLTSFFNHQLNFVSCTWS